LYDAEHQGEALLVIVAKAGDEVVGCGGTIAKWVDADVIVLLLYEEDRKTIEELTEFRENRDKVAEVLKVQKVISSNDGWSTIKKCRPNIIITYHWIENPYVFDNVMEVCRTDESFECLMCFEPYGWQYQSWIANMFVDINIDTKISAAKIYKLNTDIVKAHSKYVGGLCGADYAEAFQIVWLREK
jgi:hypothetical protein